MTEFIKSIFLNKIFKKCLNNQTEAQEKEAQDKTESEEREICRICNIKNGSQLLYNPCPCVGQFSYIHRNCLTIWFERARYDVLCPDCKARYVRIKYRQNSSFFVWLKEEPKVKRHVLIGAIAFPIMFLMVLFGCIKAGMANTGDIFKVLFVPTMAFGFLTIWKFVGSLALILKAYKKWKISRLNTKSDSKPKVEKKSQ